MNGRKVIHTLYLLACIALAVSSPAAVIPEKFRILSMDLNEARIAMEGATDEVTQGVQQMLNRADPDIICLQGVRDWETSERIAEIRPGFRVLICSGFATAEEGGSGTAQVAILARDRAMLAWVEELHASQAFAYALLKVGDRKLGVFSVESPGPITIGDTAAGTSVLEEVRKLEGFQQNRPEAIVVAGTGLAEHAAFAEAGFQTATLHAPAGLELYGSAFWVQKAGLLSLPRAVAVPGLVAPALVADVDAVNAFSSKFAYQSTLLFPGETAPPTSTSASPANPASLARQWLWPVIVLLLGVVLGLLLFGGRRRRLAPVQVLPPGENGGAVLPVGAAENTTARGHLLAWLKTAFVHRLISQRQRLIENEEDATRRTLEIEAKLTKLQSSLQERISAYETRILRLEDELSAATSENRDLIRGQIELLKEKLVQAREEHKMRRN